MLLLPVRTQCVRSGRNRDLVRMCRLARGKFPTLGCDMNVYRRHFLRCASAVAVGFAALRQLTGCERVSSEVSDKSKAVKDLFALPPGFVAKPISAVGREMSDR